MNQTALSILVNCSRTPIRTYQMGNASGVSKLDAERRAHRQCRQEVIVLEFVLFNSKLVMLLYVMGTISQALSHPYPLVSQCSHVWGGIWVGSAAAAADM
jgi:hypothetical protein